MSAYVGRNTFKASIAPIVAQGLMSNAQAGLIETCYFILYGAGHLINGILADRLNPYKMITTGLCGSALANLIMAFSPPYPVMLTVWAANGFLQAMLWSPILALFSRAILPELRETACFRIFTSSPVGTVLAYLLVVLTADIDYRIPFLSATVILLVVAASFLILSRIARPSLLSWKVQRPAQSQSAPTSPLLPTVLRLGIPFIALATVMHGMLKEGVLTWVPSLITDTYKVDAVFSVFLSMLLPLSTLFGGALSKCAYHRLFKENEAKTAGFFMLISIPPIFAVSRMASLPLPLSVACLALISMLMTAFNYMVSTMIPMRMAETGRTATFSGIFNSSVYLGSALSTFAFGGLADRFGWGFTVTTWLFIALVALLLLIGVSRRWGRYRNR